MEKKILTPQYAKYRKTKLEYSKKYYWENKEKKRIYDKKRREKILGKKLKNLKRNCIVCNKPIKFSKKNIMVLVCSKICSNKHKNNLSSDLIKKRYKSNLKEGLCAKCGLIKLIHSGYGSKVYCKECHKIHLKRIRDYANVREKRFEITNCIICGIDITDRLSLAKYCIRCADRLRELYKKYGLDAKKGVVFLTKQKGGLNSSQP